MGVKYFNRYIKENCKNSLHIVNFKYLSGKKIVIDTSILLYKFKKKNALLENMFLFISLLKSNGVFPLFVFDGKPPEEKRKTLIQRVMKKREAKEKLLMLQNKLNDVEKIVDGNISYEYKQLQQIMRQLERDSTRITDEDFKDIKILMNYYNVPYVTAVDEADQLCAYLVNNNNAWACMSDDMDLFVYGCKRVLREPNISNHTVTLYDTQSIIKELKVDNDVLTLLLIILGTDYSTNVNDTPYNIRSFSCAISLYKNYEIDNDIRNSNIWFYSWLFQNDHITEEKEIELWEIHRIFGNQYNKVNEYFHEKHNNPDCLWKTDTSTMQLEQLKLLLIEKEGFVFNL